MATYPNPAIKIFQIVHQKLPLLPLAAPPSLCSLPMDGDTHNPCFNTRGHYVNGMYNSFLGRALQLSAATPPRVLSASDPGAILHCLPSSHTYTHASSLLPLVFLYLCLFDTQGSRCSPLTSALSYVSPVVSASTHCSALVRSMELLVFSC